MPSHYFTQPALLGSRRFGRSPSATGRCCCGHGFARSDSNPWTPGSLYASAKIGGIHKLLLPSRLDPRQQLRCAEAYLYVTSCGLSDLDRDADGVPCEKMCGKTLSTMQGRIKAQPYTLAASAKSASPAAQALIGVTSGPAPRPNFDCKVRKTTCKQMLSCEEAPSI